MFLDKYIDGGWVLAIRPRVTGGELFLGHTDRPFKRIRNPWRYWCADPFLIDYQGKTYLFCEAFDIFRDRGILAYRTIDEKGRVGKLHPCLDIGTHLSYPHVFCHDGTMYMCPESGAAREVAVYEATSFPDRWEKKAVLLPDTAACDSDLVTCQGVHYLLTLIYEQNTTAYVYDKLYAFRWDKDRFVPCSTAPVVHSARYARNGGAIFEYQGHLYRVSQDCEKMYGESVTFHQIQTLAPDRYQERPVRTVTVGDIRLDHHYHYDGMHTYNANEQFEIIDLQRKKWFRIERILYLIGNKLRCLFRRGH